MTEFEIKKSIIKFVIMMIIFLGCGLSVCYLVQEVQMSEYKINKANKIKINTKEINEELKKEKEK